MTFFPESCCFPFEFCCFFFDLRGVLSELRAGLEYPSSEVLLNTVTREYDAEANRKRDIETRAGVLSMTFFPESCCFPFEFCCFFFDLRGVLSELRAGRSLLYTIRRTY
jgi:hypothetical protein